MLLTFHWTARLAISSLLVASLVSLFSFCNAAPISAGPDPSASAVALQAAAPTAPLVERGPPSIHEINEEHLTFYTEVLAFATVGLIAVAVVQAALFVWQLLYMRAGLRDAQLSAKAATDGAVAAASSVEIAKLAMVVGNRAYVHHNGCRWISHMREADGKLIWRLRPLWTNTGNTPTRQLRVAVKYALLDAQIADDNSSVALGLDSLAMIAARGEIESECFDLTGEELYEVKKSHKFLYVWGRACYFDVFPKSTEHVTEFGVFATRLTGDPQLPWHDTNNRFDIHFVAHGPHNGADDECATVS